MGIRNTFFVATPPQLERFDVGAGVPTDADYPKLEFGGFSSIEFMAAEASLRGVAVESVRPAETLKTGSTHDGPWLLLFPDTFVSALRSADGKALRKAAAAMAASEEINAKDNPKVIASLLLVLEGLKALSERTGPGARLCLWMAL